MLFLLLLLFISTLPLYSIDSILLDEEEYILSDGIYSLSTNSNGSKAIVVDGARQLSLITHLETDSSGILLKPSYLHSDIAAKSDELFISHMDSTLWKPLTSDQFQAEFGIDIKNSPSLKGDINFSEFINDEIYSVVVAKLLTVSPMNEESRKIMIRSVILKMTEDITTRDTVVIESSKTAYFRELLGFRNDTIIATSASGYMRMYEPDRIPFISMFSSEGKFLKTIVQCPSFYENRKVPMYFRNHVRSDFVDEKMYYSNALDQIVYRYNFDSGTIDTISKPNLFTKINTDYLKAAEEKLAKNVVPPFNYFPYLLHDLYVDETNDNIELFYSMRTDSITELRLKTIDIDTGAEVRDTKLIDMDDSIKATDYNPNLKTLYWVEYSNENYYIKQRKF